MHIQPPRHDYGRLLTKQRALKTVITFKTFSGGGSRTYIGAAQYM